MPSARHEGIVNNHFERLSFRVGASLLFLKYLKYFVQIGDIEQFCVPFGLPHCSLFHIYFVNLHPQIIRQY